MYDTELMDQIGTRTTLGVQALLHNQVDHKIGLNDKFKQLRLVNWKTFPVKRQIDDHGTPWMYRWGRKYLESRQLLYCYGGTTTPLPMFLHSVCFCLQENNRSVNNDLDDLYNMISNFTQKVWGDHVTDQVRDKDVVNRAVEWLTKPRVMNWYEEQALPTKIAEKEARQEKKCQCDEDPWLMEEDLDHDFTENDNTVLEQEVFKVVEQASQADKEVKTHCVSQDGRRRIL